MIHGYVHKVRLVSLLIVMNVEGTIVKRALRRASFLPSSPNKNIRIVDILDIVDSFPMEIILMRTKPYSNVI